MDEKTKIILHADTSLTKEQAKAINEAVGKVGPIQMAGMGLAMTMERTANALKEGLDKIEEAEKIFDANLEPTKDPEEHAADVLETVQDLKEELAKMVMDRNQLDKLNEYHRDEVIKGNQYREKLKDTIVQLHERLNNKNEQIDALIKEKDVLSMDLQRANRVIDKMTKEKSVETDSES